MSEDLRLHIGGVEPKAGWKILNAEAGPHVDFHGDLSLLQRFADGSVAEIYASHVIEHVSYQRELPQVLRELHRILRPGGRMMVSVPDLAVLCRLYAGGKLNADQRYDVMRVIYGGQVNAFDFHLAGFDKELLGRYLAAAGFRPVRRVRAFGLFEDTSTLTMLGEAISLNVEATKPA